MLAFLAALAPVIILVALGRLIAARGLVPPEGWRGVERLSYLVLFPALIVRELARAPLDVAPWGMMLALVGAQLVLAGAGVAASLLGLLNGPAVGSVIQSNVRWNTFVGLAIAGALYGADGLALTAVAAAALIPMANILSVFALTHYADRAPGTRPRVLRDLTRNPLLIACVVGAMLNVTGLAPRGILDDTLRLLAQATIALGLLTAGAGIDLGALARSGPRTLGWSLVRLLGFPAIALALAAALRLPAEQGLIVAIAAATPTATTGYVLARQLGGDTALSANLIAVQTVLAALSMPLVFWLAQAFTG